MSFKDVKNFKDIIKGSEFIVFDTETTGLSAETDKIIEFSAIKMAVSENGNAKLIDEIDIFINPERELPEEIVKITGITYEMVKEGLKEDAAFIKIKEFFGEKPVIVGYNTPFDIKFVNELYKRHEGLYEYSFQLDVLKLAKEKLPKPHKLINVCEKFGIDEKYRFHRSIEDVKATYDVLLALMPYYKEDDTKKLIVTGATRWSKYGYDRVYITSADKDSIFYDVNSGCWNIYGDYDEEQVKKAVYDAIGVSNDSELVEKVA